jgi:hypothetical protein
VLVVSVGGCISVLSSALLCHGLSFILCFGFSFHKIDGRAEVADVCLQKNTKLDANKFVNTKQTDSK